MKLELILGFIYLVLNTCLFILVSNLFKFLILGWILIISGSSIRSYFKEYKLKTKKIRKSKKLSVIVEDPLLLKAKKECEQTEGELFQQEFMASLKKTLGSQSSPSILKEAYLLSQNGRMDLWRKKERRTKKQ